MLFADLKIFRPALLARPAAMVAATLAAIFLLAGPAQASSRIKDLASVEGIRENHLVGYGLVVGLDGTGDSLRNAPFTRQSLQAMLERLGVNTRDANLNTDNVAAVMVTGNLPAFGAQGSRMDISVATLGDATSLLGGTLLVTPLMGADGEVYAVAQGPVAVAGFSAEGDGASVKRGVATSGRIPNGAIIEREIAFALDDLSTVRLSLHNPDLTTAQRMANVINTFIGGDTATATDPSTVALSIPRNGKNAVVSMLTEIEQLHLDAIRAAERTIDGKSHQMTPNDICGGSVCRISFPAAGRRFVARPERGGVHGQRAGGVRVGVHGDHLPRLLARAGGKHERCGYNG